MKEKLTIRLTEFMSTCSEGCCTDFGNITEINGEILPNHNTDTSTILKQILKHLGYDVEIINEYDEI